MKCPLCIHQDMEKIGNIKKSKIYFCRDCNKEQIKKKLKTRLIWIDDKTSLTNYKLIEGKIKLK